VAGPARGHVRSFAPVLLPTPPGRAETHVAWGSRRHHTGTRGWAGVGLVIRAGTEEAPLQLLHLLGQDALLIPGPVPATLQLAVFFPGKNGPQEGDGRQSYQEGYQLALLFAGEYEPQEARGDSRVARTRERRSLVEQPRGERWGTESPWLRRALPEPLILQHELLQHPIEVPLGPGHPRPTEP